jgi:hypothetical protein
MSTSRAGGGTGFNVNISHEARKVFDTALHGFVGARYNRSPLPLRSWPARTTACFVCQATVVYLGYAARGQGLHLSTTGR